MNIPKKLHHVCSDTSLNSPNASSITAPKNLKQSKMSDKMKKLLSQKSQEFPEIPQAAKTQTKMKTVCWNSLTRIDTSNVKKLDQGDTMLSETATKTFRRKKHINLYLLDRLSLQTVAENQRIKQKLSEYDHQFKQRYLFPV